MRNRDRKTRFSLKCVFYLLVYSIEDNLEQFLLVTKQNKNDLKIVILNYPSPQMPLRTCTLTYVNHIQLKLMNSSSFQVTIMQNSNTLLTTFNQ